MSVNITPALELKNLIKTALPKKKDRVIAKYLNLYEDDKHLAEVRFTQDTIVNWVPKVLFSRSLADFSEMTFLELSENVLVYYGGTFLSKNVFQKIFLRGLSQQMKEKMSTSAVELMKDKNSQTTKKLIPLKAALAVCGLVIPIAEYSLNYVKNLLTLKVFKQADFNNIANLNKEKNENVEKQQNMKKSAIKHLKIAGGIFTGCLGFATLLATKGKNSKPLQLISEFILAPGSKIFKNNTIKAAGINKYFGLDSSKLSRGQLTVCVIAAMFGYTGAAKDRGKQNLLEVVFRLPLVLFYVVTGSEMLEKAYKKILSKQGKCKEILEAEASHPEKEMPKMINLPELAKKLAVKNNSSVEVEFKKLLGQKAAIAGVPLAFSLLFMGFFVAGYSRFFTQYRYNKENKQKNPQFGSKVDFASFARQ